MNIVNCEFNDLDELYEKSALTFEGTIVDDENLNWLIEWFEEHNCKMLKENFYVISGRQMNQKYHLTGSNAYPDSLTILCVKLEDLSSVKNIVIPRFELNGRWFNDVVDNNLRREK